MKSVKSGCETLAEGAFGFACLNSNDLIHHNFVTFVSSAFSSGNGTSITPDTFEKVMVVVAVRRAIKPTWLNNRDQFRIPEYDGFALHEENPNPEICADFSIPITLKAWDEFVLACVVWNLFSGHNQTSEFTADYKGKKWRIENQFFPFSQKLPQEHGPQTRAFQRAIPKEETFVDGWLREQLLSKEPENTLITDVMNYGLDYYRLFFQNYANVNRAKWKIERARPGFYQIRNAMKEAGIGVAEYDKLRAAVKELQDWIVPRIYEYGFLDKLK